MCEAVELNINHGNGSDCASWQGCDSWRETERPRRHAAALVTVVSRLGAGVPWLFLVADLRAAEKYASLLRNTIVQKPTCLKPAAQPGAGRGCCRVSFPGPSSSLGVTQVSGPKAQSQVCVWGWGAASPCSSSAGRLPSPRRGAPTLEVPTKAYTGQGTGSLEAQRAEGGEVREEEPAGAPGEPPGSPCSEAGALVKQAWSQSRPPHGCAPLP